MKKVLALEKAESGNTFIGKLVADLVIEKYGNDPKYRKILKEAGLFE